MHNTIYTATTNDIRISVETLYQEELSQPHRADFVFAYRITIQNNSPYTVQLLRRHWHIEDATGDKREVKGEGVVGVQPVLQPNERHQYVSGAHLRAEVGQMYGSFTMLRQVDSALFEATIPRFVLQTSFKKN